jgi:transcriptional regulator with XRE-family HTH domain
MQTMNYSVKMKITEFALNLKRLRTNAGLSQSDLAKRINTGRQAVWGWENGASYPQTAQLVPLADALGCTVDNLIRQTSEASQP